MSRKYKNVFPGLAFHMKKKYHNHFELASILGISNESIVKRLRGEVEFELSEIKRLMCEYRASFENLFALDYRNEHLIVNIQDRGDQL